MDMKKMFGPLFAAAAITQFGIAQSSADDLEARCVVPGMNYIGIARTQDDAQRFDSRAFFLSLDARARTELLEASGLSERDIVDGYVTFNFNLPKDGTYLPGDAPQGTMMTAGLNIGAMPTYVRDGVRVSVHGQEDLSGRFFTPREVSPHLASNAISFAADAICADVHVGRIDDARPIVTSISVDYKPSQDATQESSIEGDGNVVTQQITQENTFNFAVVIGNSGDVALAQDGSVAIVGDGNRVAYLPTVVEPRASLGDFSTYGGVRAPAPEAYIPAPMGPRERAMPPVGEHVADAPARTPGLCLDDMLDMSRLVPGRDLPLLEGVRQYAHIGLSPGEGYAFFVRNERLGIDGYFGVQANDDGSVVGLGLYDRSGSLIASSQVASERALLKHLADEEGSAILLTHYQDGNGLQFQAPTAGSGLIEVVKLDAYCDPIETFYQGPGTNLPSSGSGRIGFGADRDITVGRIGSEHLIIREVPSLPAGYAPSGGEHRWDRKDTYDGIDGRSY